MNVFQLIPYYIVWHYTQGVRDLVSVWCNFLWFIPSFFSIKTLLSTFFSPFERLNENYQRGFSVENFFSTLAVNMIMRLVGMFSRLFVILFGILSYLIVIITGVLVVIGWIVMPVIVLFLLSLSIEAFTNKP